MTKKKFKENRLVILTHAYISLYATYKYRHTNKRRRSHVCLYIMQIYKKKASCASKDLNKSFFLMKYFLNLIKKFFA